MKLNHVYTGLFTLCTIMLFACLYSGDMGKRETIFLSNQWKFINREADNGADPGINGEDWETVEVPHDWVIHTAGVPHQLQLDAVKEIIRADGRDFITVSVIDRNGYFCPKSCNKVCVGVEGAAKLLTISNGDQTSLERYSTDHRRVFNGKSVAYIRSNGDQGIMKVTVNSEGLQQGAVKLEADLRDKPDYPKIKVFLRQKYQEKKEMLGLEDVFGMEGDRRIRLVQSSPFFAAMVEAMDEAVGKVLDKLESEGLQENTIVIFMSDNGGMATPNAPHNRGGCPTCNLPLRAGKSYLFEGGIREPMIISWPGVTTPGTVCDVPVISTDFYPTMLEMAGLPLRPGQHLDGISLVSLLKYEKEPEREPIHFHFPHYGNEGGRPSSAKRQGRYKLIRFYEDERAELYDLSVDIREVHDISADYPEITRELLGKLIPGLRKPVRVYHRRMIFMIRTLPEKLS